jgi:hypothetical protein
LIVPPVAAELDSLAAISKVQSSKFNKAQQSAPTHEAPQIFSSFVFLLFLFVSKTPLMGCGPFSILVAKIWQSVKAMHQQKVPLFPKAFHLKTV